MVWDKSLGEALHSAPSFAKPHGTPGGQEDTELLSREYSAQGHAGRQGQARTQTQDATLGFPNSGSESAGSLLKAETILESTLTP